MLLLGNGTVVTRTKERGLIHDGAVVMDGGIITVNADTAAKLGIDYSVFKDMAGTVKEVTTQE